MPEKITLTGVPETMLQTVYARARKARDAAQSAMKRRSRSLEVLTMIFPSRRRIRPCAAA